MKKHLKSNIASSIFTFTAFVTLLVAYQATRWDKILQGLQARSADEALSQAKQVFRVVDQYYVDKTKIRSKIMCRKAIAYLVDQYDKVKSVEVRDPDTLKIFYAKDRDGHTINCKFAKDLNMLPHILANVSQYLEKKLPKDLSEEESKEKKDLISILIQGALKTLDPHTILLSKTDYQDLKSQTRGAFGGLGIVVTIKDDILTIVKPIKGSPAHKQGVGKGDRIVKIDDLPTYGQNLDVLVEKMRGEPGSSVYLSILREGYNIPKRIKIVREKIKIQNVESKYLGDGIAWLGINSFGGPVASDVRDAIDTLQSKHKKLKGVILDLRDNPGGLLDEAVNVADIFVDSGILVSTKSANSKELFAKKANTIADLPVTVLLNNGSASASEIVAGALQDHERALIIGTKSFGKGSVQTLFDLKNEGALKLTVSKYYTPSGRSIQNYGITPDIEINPVVIDFKKKEAHFTLLQVGRREKDLDSHLENLEGKFYQTRLRINHVIPFYDKEDKKMLSMESEGEKLDKDFSVNFSKSILSKINKRLPVKDTSVFDIYKKMTNQFETYRKQEQNKLIENLKKLNVNWSGGEKTIVYKEGLNVGLSLNPKRKKYKAGENVQVSLSLKNRTKKDLYQIRALLISEKEILNSKEFVYGLLKSNETIKLKKFIKIPEHYGNESTAFKVSVYSQDVEVFKSKPYTIDTIDIPDPKFSHSIKIASKIIEPSELGKTKQKTALEIDLKNVGKGSSKEIIVSLNNLVGKHVHIEPSEIKLSSIKKGESKHLKFYISIDPKISIKDFSLGLKVFDDSFKVKLLDNIEFQKSNYKGKKGFSLKEKKPVIGSLGFKR